MARRRTRTEKNLNVGLIGAGFMGKMHLEGLGRIVGAGMLPIRLRAIAGRNHRKGRALARKLECDYHEGGESLIGDPEIDAVIIASPTDTHLELVTSAAAAGKAIFLEKPLGRNLAEARAVAKMIRRSGTIHQIGLALRFSPTYRVLRELLADPENGKFVFCRFRDDQFYPFGDIYDSDWRADAKKSGGGTLIEHSIHDIDVIRWFFGNPKLTGVVMRNSHRPGIESVAGLNMKFSSGGTAQLSSIWHRNFSRPNERHIEIFFENRYFETAGAFTSPIVTQGPRGKPKILSSRRIEARFREMVGWTDRKNAGFPSTIGYELYVFLDNVLKGKKESAVDVAEGLAAHQLIESAYRMGKKR